MKKKSSIWSILSVVFVLLGIFSMSRAFSELMHHTGNGKRLVLHVFSAVLWLIIAYLISRRQKKEGEGEIPPSELASSIQKKLALPYKLLPDKVPPDALMRFFRRTVKETKGQGFTPILVPAEEALDRMLEGLTEEGGISAETALAAQPSDGKAILDRRWRALFATDEEAQDPPAELLGELSGSKEQIHFLSCKTAEGAPKEVLMLRLPTDQPWQAPAYIPAGGQNGMPDTGELLAVCKYWYDKYRAAPAAMGCNTMEFVLPKVIPQDQAMDVAKEHFAFCPDRVLRDTESKTIGEVADGLWQSTLWYFRWYGTDTHPDTQPDTQKEDDAVAVSD